MKFLREEINRLKDHKNKPKIKPSALNAKKKKKKKNNPSDKKQGHIAPDSPTTPDRIEMIEFFKFAASITC
ncbi:MAG: hypothetical protein JSR33_09490 [Proteobacteria bacterium]|nr:hypothetical protein [Pseudomonadota bacterium]